MSTTPNGTQIIAHKADGTETDLTEGVQTLYDLVIQSLDWGSGFFTVEDALPVVHVAKTCGFDTADVAESYVNDRRFDEEQEVFVMSHQIKPLSPYGGFPIEPIKHDHVLGSSGRCLWPRCLVGDSSDW